MACTDGVAGIILAITPAFIAGTFGMIGAMHVASFVKKVGRTGATYDATSARIDATCGAANSSKTADNCSNSGKASRSASSTG